MTMYMVVLDLGEKKAPRRIIALTSYDLRLLCLHVPVG